MNNNTRRLNSLLPLGAPVEAATNAVANVRANVNAAANKLLNTAGLSGSSGPSMTGLGIFAAFIVGFLVLLYFYKQEIQEGYDMLVRKIREWTGASTSPMLPLEPPGQDVLKPAVPPQDETPLQKETTKPLVEKILPNLGNPEVFNISKNSFTYYDAEPLCKALGAELATYDQVKESWEKGADWCNYGWVKGQAAVYPTQQETWDKLQAGPEDQRTSCGVPGMNGGYFDNPELRFGVTCYGPKPVQSKHDESIMYKGAPRSPGQLEFDKKVAKFRTEAASLGIMPFNTQKWSSA
jgi:hypothetical protein